MARTAAIVLVGNELLSGKVVDTNAAYLCRELRQLGVDVRRIGVVPDVVDDIASEVAAATRAVDVVFTSGGVGPTHDDVTVAGVARALGVAVVRHPALAELLARFYGGRETPAHLRMADVPAGAELLEAGVRFPTVRAGNVYLLPGVPSIFRQKFEALRERFREAPFHLREVYVGIGEGTLAEHLDALVVGFPGLLLGSYPELGNAEYRVKVTLESRDAGLVAGALGAFLERLPPGAVVRVT